MAPPTSKPGLETERSLMARWQVLTQRRLDYLVELQNSGRWERYHTLGETLDMIQEAREALAAWQRLAQKIGMAVARADAASAEAAEQIPLPDNAAIGEVRAAAG